MGTAVIKVSVVKRRPLLSALLSDEEKAPAVLRSRAFVIVQAAL
jgi:hypothetical protein